MQHIRRALLAPGVLRYLEVPNAASSNFLMQKTEASAALLSSKLCLSQGFSSNTQQEPASRAQINRMMYRARQRGWLELDLLVGMWAERQIQQLSPQMLNDFEVLLDQENPELYKWLTGQIEPPEAMSQNVAFQSIRGEVKAAMDAHGAPAAAAKEGQQWVNAWQEYKKQLEDAGAKLGGGGGSSEDVKP